MFSHIFDVYDGTHKKYSFADILAFSQKTLLFFYPKDDTPGCSVENQDFTTFQEDFSALGIQLVGVSRDSVENHKKFFEKYHLKNMLICDEDLVLHTHFGAYGEKNNYGKIVMGVIRSSFLLDGEGNILHAWKNIKAKWHAQKVLAQLQGETS